MIAALRHHARSYARLLKEALLELLGNDPLRMAGATAFFTTFALPPILIILIQVLNLVIDPEKVRMELFRHLSSIVGREAVGEIVDVLRAVRQLAANWWITAGGFIFLLFVATTLFKVIRNSINQIWKMRPDPGRTVVRGLTSRAKSVAVILVAAVLFIVGLLAEGAQAFIGKHLFQISPIASLYVNNSLSIIISICIVTLWFAIVFRYLPDGRPEWSIALAGAFMTSLLFACGKILLRWLLTYSNLNTLYGTSASIVLLLLFVFYASLILYFGAAFTKRLGFHHAKPIRPLAHAMHYKVIEAEMEEGKTDSAI